LSLDLAADLTAFQGLRSAHAKVTLARCPAWGAGGKEEADWLRERLTKATTDSKEITRVQRLLQADRQRTMHLAEVDDDELRKTLEAASDVAVQIGVYDDRRIIEFPETAITWVIFVDPSASTCTLRVEVSIMGKSSLTAAAVDGVSSTAACVLAGSSFSRLVRRPGVPGSPLRCESVGR
jgi:uncharacterized membrane protein